MSFAREEFDALVTRVRHLEEGHRAVAGRVDAMESILSSIQQSMSAMRVDLSATRHSTDRLSDQVTTTFYRLEILLKQAVLAKTIDVSSGEKT